MRRKTKEIMCGNVPIGGEAPIPIQSMTNTRTESVEETVDQILRLEEAGCEIVRCAVPSQEAADALEKIRGRIHIPLVADIHFDYRLALAAIDAGADKIRINPGNIGEERRLLAVVEAAKARGIPIRIGVNAGSLEKDILQKYGGITPEGLAESAKKNVAIVEAMGYDNLVVSMKASDVAMNYRAHLLLADQIPYPFHIGITESGSLRHGQIKSAVGLGALLLHGLGDTVRVSLTGDPMQEIYTAQEILQDCGIRRSGIQWISCPTCGRTRVNLPEIVDEVERALEDVREPLTIAMMGCEVNGPGEAREADFGLAFGKDRVAIFQKGEIIGVAEPKQGIESFIQMIRGREWKN